MTQNNDSLAKSAVGCLSVLVTLAVGAPLRSWVLIQIYDWHLRPVFGGPHWTVIQGWAFNIFIAALIPQFPCDAEAPERTVGQEILRQVFLTLWPLLSLALAWILK